MEGHIALQLQSGGFGYYHVPGAGLQSMCGYGHSNVPQHEGMPACRLKDLPRKRGAGGLAVGTGDAYKIRMGIPVSQFDFGDDLDSPAAGFQNKGLGHGYDGTDDHQFHAVQQIHGIVPQPDLIGHAGKSVKKPLDLRFHIVDDDSIPLLIQKAGSGNTALGHAYDERCFLLHMLYLLSESFIADTAADQKGRLPP